MSLNYICLRAEWENLAADKDGGLPEVGDVRQKVLILAEDEP